MAAQGDGDRSLKIPRSSAAALQEPTCANGGDHNISTGKVASSRGRQKFYEFYDIMSDTGATQSLAPIAPTSPTIIHARPNRTNTSLMPVGGTENPYLKFIGERYGTPSSTVSFPKQRDNLTPTSYPGQRSATAPETQQVFKFHYLGKYIGSILVSWANYSIDSDDTRVCSASQAAVKVERGKLLYKVEYLQAQTTHPDCMRLLGSHPYPSGKLFWAWLPEDDHLASTGTCNGFLTPDIEDRRSTSMTQLLAAENEKQLRTIDPSRQAPCQNLSVTMKAIKPTDVSSTGGDTIREAQLRRFINLDGGLDPSHPSNSATIKTTPTLSHPEKDDIFRSAILNSSDLGIQRPVEFGRGTKGRRPAPRLSNFVPTPETLDEQEHELNAAANAGRSVLSRAQEPKMDLNPRIFAPFIPIKIKPEEYEIYLVLDWREIRAKGDRDYIEQELKKKGVRVIRESLNLGDVTWIAKSRDGQTFSLDYILERKRLDDLCGSIKDGRFHDQKVSPIIRDIGERVTNILQYQFRLGQSAITHIFYLVEEYEPEKFHGFFDLQINTALSQTLMVDNFIVQETRSVQFTIDYLSRLHEKIVERHRVRCLA